MISHVKNHVIPKYSASLESCNLAVLLYKVKGKVFYGQEPPSGECILPQKVGSIINYLQ